MAVEWFLDGHSGTDRKQYLWEMFHRVINFGSVNLFMDSLMGFIGHELLDDGACRIDWRVLKVDSSYMLVWDRANNEHEHLVVTQDNLQSLPIVVYERNDGRTADVSELLEAMDICFQRNRKRIEELRNLLWAILVLSFMEQLLHRLHHNAHNLQGSCILLPTAPFTIF